MGPNIKDIGAYIDAATAISPRNSGAATVNGTGLSRDGRRSGVVLGSVGAVSGAPTAVSIQFKLQDSADNTTFADVAGASATATAANSEVEFDVDLSGLKKFVRVVAVVSFTGGTAPTADISAALVQGGAEVLPV